MKNRFAYLLGFSAFVLVTIAAYFSITGFAKLFSGASYSIMIMTGGLELGKLVTLSFLYRYWDSINKIFRGYLIFAVFILAIITSAGVYGFLSSAYSITADKLSSVDSQIELIEKKKQITQEKINRTKLIIDSKSNRVNSLSSLRLNQESRIDTLYKKGLLGGVRKTELIIKESNLEIDKIGKEIEELNKSIQPDLDTINKGDLKIIEFKASDVKGEIGPLKYIALLTGKSIESVVNFFILLLIFVCDPLAMCLVIATNKVLIEEGKQKEILPIISKNEVKYESNQFKEEKQKSMKIIVTTSNTHLHILPVFCFLFNKYWDRNQEVEIVGYNKPLFELPSNFKFISLGEQGTKKDFSNTLKLHFEKQDEFFIWMMEDSFIKSEVDFEGLEILKSLAKPGVGRINLSRECVKQDHGFLFKVKERDVFQNTQVARYRLSTQPSIWNRDFLLQYLTKDLSPWDFETQDAVNDGFRILGLGEAVVNHNEGVTRHDLNLFDLSGIPEEVISEMKSLKIIV